MGSHPARFQVWCVYQLHHKAKVPVVADSNYNFSVQLNLPFLREKRRSNVDHTVPLVVFLPIKFDMLPRFVTPKLTTNRRTHLVDGTPAILLVTEGANHIHRRNHRGRPSNLSFNMLLPYVFLDYPYLPARHREDIRATITTTGTLAVYGKIVHAVFHVLYHRF